MGTFLNAASLAGLAATFVLVACADQINIVNHPFGIECQMTEGSGCRCFLSSTPNDVVCDAETVAGKCRKLSNWPQPLGYSSSSPSVPTESSPGCECLPLGPRRPAKVDCNGQGSTGTIGKDDSCYCNVGDPSSTEKSCAVSSSAVGNCCVKGTSCRCSTYSFNMACESDEKKVASCTGKVFPTYDPVEPDFTSGLTSTYSSYSSATDTTSCVDVPLDRADAGL